MGGLGGVLGNYDSGEDYVRKKEMRVDMMWYDVV